jgi:hypothetical protein
VFGSSAFSLLPAVKRSVSVTDFLSFPRRSSQAGVRSVQLIR